MIKKTKSEVRTVMFIDLVGYTKKTTQLKRDEFNNYHDIFDSLAIPIFDKFEGQIIKKIGDAFLITFTSATDAVLCGVELQKAFMKYSKENPENPLQIRVALHTGEVIVRQNDIYGDCVNTAARIESIAKPNHIVFSETVFASMNKNEIPFVHLGLKRFKGLKYPIRIFRVKGKKDIIAQKDSFLKTFIKVFLLLIFFVVVAVLGSQFLSALA